MALDSSIKILYVYVVSLKFLYVVFHDILKYTILIDNYLRYMIFCLWLHLDIFSSIPNNSAVVKTCYSNRVLKAVVFKTHQSLKLLC